MRRLFLLISTFLLLAGCCSSGTKRDWLSHEVEIAPIKSFESDGGYEGGEYLSERYKRLNADGDKEESFLDIRNFDEYQWGYIYTARVRGYTEVRCGMQDAPTEIRFFKPEKIISKRSINKDECISDFLPKMYDFKSESIYSTWKEAFVHLKVDISDKDASSIKTSIGSHRIDYEVCFPDPNASSVVKIQNVVVQP